MRIPATTSSPCAFSRKSPKKIFSPVEGSRVKQTPVPESSPVFPNTICTTFTAVPRSPVIFSTRRYVTAFSPIHDSNTAPIAPQSCSIGIFGKILPGLFLEIGLVLANKLPPALARALAYRLSRREIPSFCADGLRDLPSEDRSRRSNTSARSGGRHPRQIAHSPWPCASPSTEFVVQPEIENCLHHSGHRTRRARPHADEQRILGVAQFLPGEFFETRDMFLMTSARSSFGILVAVLQDSSRRPPW